ncbi:MAG: AI-2E family transporter [bacterium]|nr:AI-2E family transporter [bacterium]
METLHNNKLQHYFFLILFLMVAGIMLFIFKPFIAPLVLAISFAVVFHPLYTYFLRRWKGRKTLASLSTLLVIIILVLLPVAVLGSLLFSEAAGLYDSIAVRGGGAGVFTNQISNLESYLQGFFPELTLDIASYAQAGLQWIVGNFGAVFTRFLTVGLDLFIMLVALFYLFKDGDSLRKHYIELSPLVNEYDEQIFKKLAVAINSVIKGSLVIAIIQGVLAGLGMLIFGVPSPIIWGSTAMIAGLIPGIGTALVIIPAVLYLVFTGSSGAAIGLAIWGVVVVGLVDNFLSPNLINRGIKIHPMLILISVLGGIILFGPIGFLLGPLVLALFFALLDIYPLMLK